MIPQTRFAAHGSCCTPGAYSAPCRTFEYGSPVLVLSSASPLDRRHRLKLKEKGAKVAELADRVGYRPEAAFSRAFKKLVGTPPATWRRR